MRIKKYLKQQAQQNLRDLETEGDREFLAHMKESVGEAPKSKRNLQWLWAIPSVAACAVAVVLIVEFVPFSGDPIDDVKYDEDNFVEVDSDFTELSGALKNLTLHIAEVSDVRKTYDSVSGHDIFYTINIEEISDIVFYKMEARIIVNSKYEFDDFEIGKKFVTEIYSNYSVTYMQEIKSSETGLNLVQCSAKIESENYEIYVTNYEEYSLENGSFLTVINEIFDFS